MAEEVLDANNQPTDPPKAEEVKVKKAQAQLPAADVVANGVKNKVDPTKIGEYLHSNQDLLTPTLTSPGVAKGVNLNTAVDLVGDFNITDRDFSRDYRNAIEKQSYDAALQRHEDQAWWQQAGGFVAQAVAGEITLGILEGTGYLIDVDQWVNFTGTSQGEVGNWFSDMMVEGKEKIRELAPIEMDPYKAGEFDMASSSWWFSNGVSVASAVSIMIPVAGWARAAGMVGKLAKYASTIGRASKLGKAGAKGMAGISKMFGGAKAFSWVDEAAELGLNTMNLKKLGSGLNQAIASRHIEGMMEASGVYREKREELMDKGFSEEEANKYAADGASQTYMFDWAMIVQDIPQYLALGKGANILKAARGKKLLAAQAKSLGVKAPNSAWANAKYKTGKYGGVAASEGFEEMYQFIAAEEGKHTVDVAAGIKESKDLSSRLGHYLQDEELWTASFFGAMGGAAFQAVGPKMQSLAGTMLSKDEDSPVTEAQARVNAIENRTKILKGMNERLSEAAELENDAAVDAIKEDIAFELAMNGAVNGNTGLDLDAFDKIANMTPEEAEKLGLSPEFKEDIEYYRGRYEAASQLYQKNSKQFHPSTVGPITQREYTLKRLADQVPATEAAVREEIESMGLGDTMTEEGRELLKSQLQISGAQRFVDGMENQLAKNKNLTKEEQDQIKKSIKLAKEKIVSQQELLDNTRESSDGLNEMDKVVLGKDSSYVKQLSKRQAEISHLQHAMRTNSEELGALMSAEGQKNAARRMDAELKAIHKSATDKVAQEKEEANARGGAPETGISGADIAAGIEDGSITEKDLSQSETDRLNKHKAGLPEDAPLDEETDAQREDKPAQVTPEDLARKVAKGEELSKEEQAIYDQNADVVDKMAEALDQNNQPVDPTPEPDTEDTGKDIENVADAIAHETSETPVHEDNTVTDENRNIVQQAEKTDEFNGELIQRFTWLSINNDWMREDKRDPNTPLGARNIALTNYLETDNNMEGTYFILEVDEDYLSRMKSETLKANFANGVMPNGYDIPIIPIKATLYKDGKPVETPDGHKVDGLYLPSPHKGSPDSLSPKQLAQNEEWVTMREKAFAAQISGKRLRVDFNSKTKGNIKVGSNADGTFAKNNPMDVFPSAVSSKWVYGHDTQYLDKSSGQSLLSLPLAGFNSATSGAIYIAVKGANGQLFPARLRVGNLNGSEAALIYELTKTLVLNDVYAAPISDDLKKRIKGSKDARMQGLYKYLNLDTSEITNGELLNELVFSGREVTMGKKESQLWIARNKKSGIASLIIGETGNYSSSTIETTEAKKAIISHLVKNRRRQVNVSRLGDENYKQYLMDTGIVTTNAMQTSHDGPFYNPSITYKDPQVVDTPVEGEVAPESKGAAPKQDSSKAILEGEAKLIENKNQRAADLKNITQVGIPGMVMWRTPKNDIFATKEEAEKEINEYYDTKGKMITDRYITSSSKNKIDPEIKNAVANASPSTKPDNQGPTPTTETKVSYTPSGKESQEYTIVGTKIYNKKGKEVFAKDSADRRKIHANLDVQQGRAEVVTTPDGKKYVINDKGVVMSVATGKIMVAEGIIKDVIASAKEPSKYGQKPKPRLDELIIDPNEPDPLEELFGPQDTSSSTTYEPVPETKVKVPKLMTVKVNLESLTLDELRNVRKQLRQKAVDARAAEEKGEQIIGGSAAIKSDFNAVKEYIAAKEVEEAGTQAPALDPAIEGQRAEAVKEHDEVWGNRSLSAMEDGENIFQPESQEEQDEWAEHGTPWENELKAIHAKYDALQQSNKGKPTLNPIAAKNRELRESETSPSDPLNIEDVDLNNTQDPFATKIGDKDSNNFFAENEAEHIKSLLPDAIGIQLMDDYVRVLQGGWAAVGVFQNGMIELTRGAERGTGYHEAFHAVYRTMTTQKERAQLLADAVKIFPIPSEHELRSLASQHPKLSENQILELYYEEQMADEFGSFMYGQRKFLQLPAAYPKGLKGLMMRLWNWMKHVFNDPTTVHKMFNDIKMAKYKTKPLNITRSVAFKVHKHYQPKDIQEITENLVHMAMRDVKSIEDIDKLDLNKIKHGLKVTIAWAERNGNRVSYTPAGGEKQEYTIAGKKIFNNKGKEVFTKDSKDRREIYAKFAIRQSEAVESSVRLRQLYNEMYVGTLDKATGKMVVDRFFIEEVKKYLINLGLQPKKVKENNDTPVVDQDGETDPVTDEEDGALLIPKSYERSGKETAGANIKLMLALINHTEYVDGVETTVPYGYLKLPKKVNFGTIYNKLETNLAGITGHYDPNTGEWIDAYDSMIKKMNDIKAYHPEINQVLKELGKREELVQTQFHAVFSKMKGNYIDHIISGEGSNATSKITSGDLFAKESMLIEKWSGVFLHHFRLNTTDDVIYNPKAVARLNKFIGDHLAAASKYVSVATSSSKYSDARTAALGAQAKVLGAMGIELDPSALRKIIGEYDTGDATTPQLQEANQMALFSRALANSLSKIRKLEGSIDEESLPLSSEPFLKSLAAVQAEFTPAMGENMRLIAGGTQAWVYQDNNSITKGIQSIKDGDLSFINGLIDTPFGTNSVWAKELADNPEIRKKLETGLFGNYREEKVTDKGDKAAALKKGDQLNDVINKYLSGFGPHKDMKGLFIGLAEADKGQQQYIQGPTVIKSQVIGNDKGGGLMLHNNSTSVNIFAGYLADELNRWAAAWEAVHSADLTKRIPEAKQILYYHYNIKDGVRTDGNAMSSYMFPNMDMKELGIIGKDGKPIIQTKDQLMANVGAVEAIKTAILDRVQDDINVAKKYGIIATDPEGNLVNRTIDANVLSNSSTIQGNNDGARIVNAMANYTVNSMIANVEMTKLFTGDPALYKKKGDGFEDFRKRIPAATSSGRDARIFKNPDGNSWAVRPFYTSATTDDIMLPSETLSSDKDGKPSEYQKLVSEATGMTPEAVAHLFKPYNNVNRTDAQAWISFPAYKERMRAYGKWTASHEEAFTRINEGKLAPSDVKLMAMPLKTVQTGLQLLPGGVMSMQYNKQSEAPLIPGIHDKLPLKHLMKAMTDNKVDHVIVLDGKKAGAIGRTDITDGNASPLSTGMSLNPIKLNYRNLYLQQDLTTKGVKDTLVGGQAVKNVMATVTLDRIYSDDTTGLQLLEDYNKTISQLSDIGLDNYLKKIGWNPTTQELDETKLRAALIEEFEGDISDNVIFALQAGIPLDAIQIRKSVQYKINAMINKETVKLKQSGGAFVQMSDFGIMGIEIDLNTSVKDSIIFFKDPTEDLQPMTLTKNSEGEIKAKPAQVLMPHGPLLDMLQKSIDIKYPGENKTYKDLTHAEINSLVDQRALQGLIYRIPNQAPGSNDAIEIAGILPPEMGDTIIAFSEITTKTGSDFDIDKAFAILPNLYVHPTTGQIQATDINQVNKKTGKKTKKGLQNRRLWLMRKMLTHPEAYAQVMSPLDAKWLENDAKALYPAPAKGKDLAFYTGTSQLNTKAIFDNAKGLVGTIANHMTHHSLIVNERMLYRGKQLGVGMTEMIDVDGKMVEKSFISASIDVDGNAVEETLGAFMNAIVDAAKDPYISRANINQKTANVAFMLARSGASRDFIVAFMGQPILKRYVELAEITEGRISPVIRVDGRKQSALDQVLAEYGWSNVNEKRSLSAEFRESNVNLRKRGKVTITAAELKDNILNPNKEVTVDSSASELEVLGQFLEWQERSKDLGDFVKVSKADVNGATKNLVTAGIAKRLMDKVINEDKFIGLDKFLGFTKVEEDGETIIEWSGDKMIGTFFTNSVLAIKEVMKDSFVSETPAMETAMLNIAAKQGITIRPTADGEVMANKLMDNLFTAMNSVESSPYYLSQAELGQLIIGNEDKVSLGERLKAAQNAPELFDNTFIHNLATSNGKYKLPWMSPKSMDVNSKNQLYLDWLAIRKYDETLYKDLIYMSFYTSGLQNSFGSFASHIPTEFLLENGYIEFMAEMKDLMSSPTALQEMEDKVIRHLWSINEIVPSFGGGEVEPIKNLEGRALATNEIFWANPSISKQLIIGENARGNAEFKKFIKRDTSGMDESANWELYELQGYIGEGKERAPVYARTTKMGYSHKGVKLFEYFKDNGSSMIKKNKVTKYEVIEDFKDQITELPQQIVTSEVPDNNYRMTTEDLSPEEKEDATKRGMVCTISR